MNFRVCRVLLFFILLSSFIPLQLRAQEVNPSLYAGLRWRLIGPFRGGRVTCVAGVPQQPNLYYFGTPGGGVWKTTDGGVVWQPIFDQERVASIGAIAVASSDPNIIYVGTGEQTMGNGVYKSTDAGATWTNIGLKDTQNITAIIVDPSDANVVLVATALMVRSGETQGIYKTEDGGRSWRKVLSKGKDEPSLVMDMNSSPDAPKIVYAALLKPGNPQPPGQPPESRAQNAAIYKSTDEGSTWAHVGGKGLPIEAMGRIGVAVVPGTQGRKLFAIANQGLFQSEDGGDTWTRSNSDPRIVGSSYFSRVFVDPRNAEILYVAQTSMYRSTDGGRTFEAFAGAPSGDDFHVVWINPLNDQNIIFGVDQGAIISVDGGKTWSSWYNQPTGQFYHVTTDNHFPYYVYAAQQDSGTAAVASRSDYGEIRERDWAPVGGFEFAFIAPDPLNANDVYIGGWYGSILRYDKTTGQIVHVFVRTPKYRTAGLAPVVFSPQDPHTLYVGAQFVLKTTDGGLHWQEISPDLTTKPEAKPESASPTPPGQEQRVISVLAPSAIRQGEIWAGSNNGLIQVTKDGRSWENVTPAALPPGAQVRSLEASRHDPAEAYSVMALMRTREQHAMIYRTRDFGKNWTPITVGIPDSPSANVVREDPARKGLLYAGTGDAVYISFDDGDHWQSLQLNLPTATITDLAVHGDDLVASTYGRSLWILDDVTPLRQLESTVAQQDVYLFRPEEAVRVRWDMNQDTPLPVETPAGKNPPDGAIVDYILKSPSNTPIKLAIRDAHGNLVRDYSSVVPARDKTPSNVPDYWFAPTPQLPTAVGLNRFIWDLRYPEPKTLLYSYYGNRLDYIEYTLADHAIPGETPSQQPVGPLVAPGKYSVELTVDGKTLRRDLTVVPDPRVHATQQDLEEQLATEKIISLMMGITFDGYHQLVALASAIADRQKALAANAQAQNAVTALQALGGKVNLVDTGTRAELGLGPLNRELARLAVMIESGDARPAEPLREGVQEYCTQLQKRLAAWSDDNQTIAGINEQLKKYDLAALPVADKVPAALACQ